jgi:predicted dehydrogenase
LQQVQSGKVIQTVNLAPHRIFNNIGNTGLAVRPDWFWDKKRYGGILTDIGSHQFDQYLHFTGSTEAEVLMSQVGNVHHPDKPLFEDFGDVMLSGNGGTGYIRVDWFTPDGLDTWGDGRLTILGTDGFIEVRKNTDIASGLKVAIIYIWLIKKRWFTSIAIMRNCLLGLYSWMTF